MRRCPSLAASMVMTMGAGAALFLATGLLAAQAGAADLSPASALPSLPTVAPGDTALPIDLEAAFSELDRRNNRLTFRQLNIRQGALAIRADEASADPADFENSVWTFTGNVSIENAGTRTSCDRAELTFRDNQLRKAKLTGKPARFNQAGTGGNPATEGRGQFLEYDLDGATIQMVNDAFLSDGKSEISGSRIAYDLRRQIVTAGGQSGDQTGDKAGNQGGQVRMRITPQKKPASPPSPPAPPTAPPAGTAP